MRNRIINLGVVAEIAQALGDLNQSVVFVGGRMVKILMRHLGGNISEAHLTVPYNQLIRRHLSLLS